MPPSLCSLRSNRPTPFENRRLRHISSYNVSTVRDSEKSSIITNIKSTTDFFPTSHRWSAYVTQKFPKEWLKERFFRFYRASICEGGLIGSRNSVRPSVRLSIPHEMAITLLLWHQEWFVGDAPFPLKSALKVTHPASKNADFDRFPLITSQP